MSHHLLLEQDKQTPSFKEEFIQDNELGPCRPPFHPSRHRHHGCQAGYSSDSSDDESYTDLATFYHEGKILERSKYHRPFAKEGKYERREHMDELGEIAAGTYTPCAEEEAKDRVEDAGRQKAGEEIIEEIPDCSFYGGVKEPVMNVNCVTTCLLTKDAVESE